MKSIKALLIYISNSTKIEIRLWRSSFFWTYYWIKGIFIKLEEENKKFDISDLKNEIGVETYYNLILKNIDLLFLVKGILTQADSEFKNNNLMIDFAYFCNRVICKLLIQEIRVLAVKWINK